MGRVLLLEFPSDTSLQKIYKQLRYYHNQMMLVETTYNGTVLSNEDMNKLKDTITRLELELTEEEYQKYKNYDKAEKERIELYHARLKTPKVVRYWIEKTKKFLPADKQNDWEKTCYLLIQTANAKEAPVIRKQAIEFAYQTIISAAKIIIAIQNESDNTKLDEISKVIDKELYYSEDYHQLDNKYQTLSILIPFLTDKGDLYRKLTFYDEVTDDTKYSLPIDNPVTKKRIPDYLKK